MTDRSADLDTGGAAVSAEALIVQGLFRVFEAEAAALYRQDAESGEVRMLAGTPPGAVPTRLRALVGLAMAQAEPIVTPDALLVVPLISQGFVLGAIAVTRPRTRPFSADDLRIGQVLAEQTILTLEHARVYAEATQRRQGAEALAGIARLLTESLDIASVSERVVESVLTLFRANSSALYLAEADGSLRALAWGGQGRIHFEPAQVFAPGIGVVGHAVTSGQAVWTADVLNDATLVLPDDMRRRIMAAGNRAVLAVPLRVKGRIIGALSIADQGVRPFEPTEVALLQTFADQAALALENARLYDETERRRREAEGLAKFARDLTETLDVATVASRIVETVMPLVAGNSSDLRLLEPDGSLVEAACTGRVRERYEPGHRLPRGTGISGRVVEEGRSVWSPNFLDDPRIIITDDLRQRIGDTGLLAALAVPLRVKGRIIGVLSVGDTKRRNFTDAEVTLLQTFADQAAVAIDNARLFSEAQLAYEQLSRAQAQLVRSETLRAIGEVAAGAAHHLNNLLAVIVARTQLLLRRVPLSEIRRPLEVIERAATDAADVVRRIRTFSRAHPTPTLESVDLNRLVQDVVELTRPRWRDEPQRRGLSFEVLVEAGEIPPVAGEAAALREVLVNLFLNALDAMPAGGQVRLRTWADSEFVHCDVSDTGIGMSPEVQRRALDPFFTTKGPKSTGLGLSVNYGIIQAHGGDLRIDSVQGRGTTVSFYLPIARTLAEAPVQEMVPPAIRLRIVLVDDEPEVRTAIAEMLRDDGHDVLEAEDGSEGLARLTEAGRPDLVITDLGMPGMTGWDVVHATKSQDPSISAGLMTGWGDDLDGKPGDRAAPDFVLAKPVTQTALRLAVVRVAAAQQRGSGH